MKIFKMLTVAMTAVLVFCGCENSLEFVPEDAQIIVYGNTKAVFDSKIWDMLKENKTFQKELLENLKDMLGVKEIDEVSGNIALWADSVKEADKGKFEAVVVLDEGNAEEIFSAIKKQFKEQGLDVKESDVDKKDMLIVKASSESKAVMYSIVCVNSRVLHIAMGSEIDAVIDNDSDNDTACSIDQDAVFAAAGTPELWASIVKQSGVEEEVKVKDLGAGIVEVFMTKSEIEVKAKLDISDLEIK
ncbi:MAG: hypothetical protein E7057_11285 [Lentisphaerae bacterium]|nr:hypothetical protein [Lentisphaerota bacterium]